MTQSTSDHVEAGLMLRFIDGEASVVDRRAVEAHVAECAECTRELGALQEAARTVNRVLTAVLDVEAPPAQRRRSFWQEWRLAASVVLVVGALAAVPELRALVLETWRAMTGRGEMEAVPPVRPETRLRGPEMRAIVEVTPADSFAVVFDAPQAAGHVIVTAHDSATAIILSSDPHAAVMVLPSRVRIANDASRANYQIVVPSTLDNLVVTVAGRRQPVIAGGELRAGVRKVIPLQ